MIPPDIFAAVAQASSARDLPVLVIGGHAVNAYGHLRTTVDADFLVRADDLPAWREILESFNYRWRGGSEAFAQLDPPLAEVTALPVDLMLVSRETFRKLAIDARELAFGATRLLVPRPLHLVALKLHAMKNDERRRLGKDLSDILQIIRLCGIDPADAEFLETVERYANPQTRTLLATALAAR